MADILRLATAGSVDDGKSTLIGRLLYDTKQIFDDQYEAIERTRAQRGDEYTNLALLTDGLRAEREQGITIDVAYRYFATSKRKFVIADTPGHVQYTRNMVTGASTADVALILVDARNGLVEQSRRHAVLASLLRVPHLLLCVNKMDLVGYDRGVFEAIQDEFRSFATKLDVNDLTFVPISALHGDNVVTRSPSMPWYDGAPLLHTLEELHVGSARNLIDARFPVQLVLRPQSGLHHDYRAYAGTVASGVFRTGDEVVALPSGFTTVIEGIDGPDGPIDEAYPPLSVALRLRDELDLSRGDMICRPANRPTPSQDIDAMLCWMTDKPLLAGARLAIKHTTRTARAIVRQLHYHLDVNTLHRTEEAEALGLNEIGRVTLRTTAPLFADEYRHNRNTGSFILIDEQTHETVAAGLVLNAGSRG